MKRRSSVGGALILSTVFSLVLALIGVGMFYISKLIGGGLEVSNAVDAGNLNLAQKILRYPGVDLTADETNEFGDCLDLQTGQVNLLTINDVVLHTLQVAADAEEPTVPTDPKKKKKKRRIEHDPSSMKRARAVVDMCNAISARLKQRLIDFDKTSPMESTDNDNSTNTELSDNDEDVDITPDDQEDVTEIGDASGDDDDSDSDEDAPEPVETTDAYKVFLSVANKNSLRMLGDANSTNLTGIKYEYSYMNRGGASNAIVDQFDFPGRSDATTVKLADGHTYLRGYVNIPVLGTYIQAVPVQPDQLPHLVSPGDFHDNTTQPTEFAPPNAFGVSALASTTNSNGVKTTSSSYGIVGTQLAYGIRLGNYIRVVEPPGIESKLNELPSTDNVFNNELRKGIFIAADQNGAPVAFSTDKGLVEDWLTYNQTHNNRPTSTGVFNTKGEPATDAELQAMQRILLECKLKDISGPHANSVCVTLQQAFMRAYPRPSQPTATEQSDLMSVEKIKEDIISEYDRIVKEAASGQPTSTDGFVQCATLTEPTVTGLRAYTKKKFANVPDVPFSTLEKKPASVKKLLGRQFKNTRKEMKTAVFAMFGNPDPKQKVKGIKFGKQGGRGRKRTIAKWIDLDLKAILKAIKITDLDTVYYIYENPRWQYRLTFSDTPPAGTTPSIKARGNITRYTVRERKIKPNVDLLRGGNFRKDGLLFSQTLGTEIACKEVGQWTASSGANGNWGDLELRNEVNLKFNGQDTQKAYLGL